MTMLRDKAGTKEDGVVSSVAVNVCERDDRPMCRHCGVSFVKGIENGMEDGKSTDDDKDEPDGWERE